MERRTEAPPSSADGRVFGGRPTDSPLLRLQSMAGPEDALLIGSPATVAAKMLHAGEALGGVSRITLQMSTASLETAAMKRSIEFLGAEVAPLVRARAGDPGGEPPGEFAAALSRP